MSARSTNVTVRRATVEDVDAIAALQVRSWQAAYPGLMPPAYLDAQDPRQRAVRWREWLADPPPHLQVLVAERSDERDGEAGAAIVGFAAVSAYRTEEGEEHPGAHVGELCALYASPDHWGTGVGRELIDAAVSTLAHEGFTEAVLWVIDGNARARRFYERVGWTPDGVTKLDARGGWDISEVRYRRGLPPPQDRQQ